MTPGEWLEEMRRRAFLRAMATVTGATALGWWPSADQAADIPSPVAALRDVLLDHGRRLAAASGAPDLVALRSSVHELWAAFQGARYSTALTAMPDALRQAQLAVRDLDGDDRLGAAALLAQTYQAISTFMRKVGDVNLATLAADRAVAAAGLHGSSVTIAESARFLCLILGDTGHHQQAVHVCTTAAERFESDVHQPDPAAISIYGQFVAGAEAAARGGDPSLARDFFDLATGTGRRLGTDANHTASLRSARPTPPSTRSTPPSCSVTVRTLSVRPGASISRACPCWSAAPTTSSTSGSATTSSVDPRRQRSAC